METITIFDASKIGNKVNDVNISKNVILENWPFFCERKKKNKRKNKRLPIKNEEKKFEYWNRALVSQHYKISSSTKKKKI